MHEATHPPPRWTMRWGNQATYIEEAQFQYQPQDRQIQSRKDQMQVSNVDKDLGMGI